VGIFPLAGLLARQGELRWKAGLAGALLLGLGIATSFWISAHLAAPVHKLAEVSEENRILRERAETALEIKRGELERSARFSADASHQLKTPVAILRAGLDEVLTHPELPAEVRDELSLLVHQTFRLTSIIEDLLLLSRLDSGRLQLDLAPLDLNHLIETCVDDIRLLHDAEAMDVQLDLPAEIQIAGDSRYTMLILQNLLDNARKYGLPGTSIRVSAHTAGHSIGVTVANRGEPVPRGSWEHIFERFHRGSMGGNIPGHGLGLNLARELARLHGGDLRLLRSDEEWTIFEARFRAARTSVPQSDGILA
jgi:signal transduction histidine kinase